LRSGYDPTDDPFMGEREHEMFQRIVAWLVLWLAVVATAQGQQGFTVSACFSEIPGSSCSPIEAGYNQSPVLEGPIPGGAPFSAELDTSKSYYYLFRDITPGNYILRAGGCNPFGCWLDTPVTVIDHDIEVQVRQIGAETPTPIESPIATGTPTPICVGDGNGDGHVTVDELVTAVGNALTGCPGHCIPGMPCTVIGLDGLPLIGICEGPFPPGVQTYICNVPDPGPTRTPVPAG
jgi:hypothetical protein